MPGWRKNKSMAFTNRGLETIVTMRWLPETKSYRITRIERMIGAAPNQTYDRIFDPEVAVTTFAELCIKAIEQEFTFPERSGDTKVFDITDAEGDR